MLPRSSSELKFKMSSTIWPKSILMGLSLRLKWWRMSLKIVSTTCFVEATKTSSTLALMIMMRWILRLYRTEGSKEVLAKNGLEFWIFKIQFCNQFGQSKEEKGILRNLGQEEIIPYHMGQFMDLAQMEHNRPTLWSRDRPNLHATIRTLVSLETFGVELLSFYYMCLLWSLCVIRINSQLNLCLYWLCY